MGLRRIAGFALGMALLAAVLAVQDLVAIGDMMHEAGVGILLVALWHFMPLAADTVAWLVLLPSDMRPAPALALRLRWIGQSINSLLPAAQVGGDLWRIHALRREGFATGEAAAGIAADLTVAVASQVPFALAGVAMAVLLGVADVRAGAEPILAVTVAALIVTGLLWRFRARVFPLVGRVLEGWRLPAGMAGAGIAYRGIMARPGPVTGSLLWRGAGWLLGVGEVWLSFRLIGQPVDLATAFVIESLIQTVRSAGFFIPAAIGIQEGGILAIAALFGIEPETALAVAAIRRVREVLVFGPGLVALSLRETARLGRSGMRSQVDPSRSGTGRSGGPS